MLRHNHKHEEQVVSNMDHTHITHSTKSIFYKEDNEVFKKLVVNQSIHFIGIPKRI